MGLRSHHPCRGHQPATASRELIVNKRGWTPSENIEHSMDAIPAPSFGTRGSQVQILPLRPAFSAVYFVTGPYIGSETVPCQLSNHL